MRIPKLRKSIVEYSIYITIWIISTVKKKKDDLKEIKGYDRIFKNSNIKEYIPQLVKELTKNNFKFDSYFSKIHFKNGYKDLETKNFTKEY